MSIVQAVILERIRRNFRNSKARASATKGRRAKPGWFYDPRRESTYRYWTGTHWSDHISTEHRTDHPAVTPVQKKSGFLKRRRPKT